MRRVSPASLIETTLWAATYAYVADRRQVKRRAPVHDDTAPDIPWLDRALRYWNSFPALRHECREAEQHSVRDARLTRGQGKRSWKPWR
jgi:hypothetical protein